MRRTTFATSFARAAWVLGGAQPQAADWTQDFGAERSDLAFTGRNPYAAGGGLIQDGDLKLVRRGLP